MFDRYEIDITIGYPNGIRTLVKCVLYTHGLTQTHSLPMQCMETKRVSNQVQVYNIAHMLRNNIWNIAASYRKDVLIEILWVDF